MIRKMMHINSIAPIKTSWVELLYKKLVDLEVIKNGKITKKADDLIIRIKEKYPIVFDKKAYKTKQTVIHETPIRKTVKRFMKYAKEKYKVKEYIFTPYVIQELLGISVEEQLNADKGESDVK